MAETVPATIQMHNGSPHNAVPSESPLPESEQAMEESKTWCGTDAFKAVMVKRRGCARSKAREKGGNFKESTVNVIRAVFINMMIWFALVIAVWDVIVPYAAIKAANWSEDEQVSCQGQSCDESCQSLSQLEYNADCRPEPRIYDYTPLWPNDQQRHEFGHGWSFLISGHVFFAFLLFPSYLTQLGITIPGHKRHKALGGAVLVMAVLLWSFGAVAAAIMIGSRGLHPCAYVIKGYNNPGPWSRNVQSSLTLGNYLLFMFDGAVFNECLIIGIAARSLLAVSFDPRFDFVMREGTFMKFCLLNCTLEF